MIQGISDRTESVWRGLTHTRAFSSMLVTCFSSSRAASLQDDNSCGLLPPRWRSVPPPFHLCCNCNIFYVTSAPEMAGQCWRNRLESSIAVQMHWLYAHLLVMLLQPSMSFPLPLYFPDRKPTWKYVEFHETMVALQHRDGRYRYRYIQLKDFLSVLSASLKIYWRSPRRRRRSLVGRCSCWISMPCWMFFVSNET